MKKLAFMLSLILAMTGLADDPKPVSVAVPHGGNLSKDDFNEYNKQQIGSNYKCNIPSHTLILGTGITIELDADKAVNRVFTLYANILATNGAFVVNADGIDEIRWIGSLDCPQGTISVKGAKKIVFGDSHLGNNNTTASYSFFKADVAFEAEEAEEAEDAYGIVFTNGFTCAQLPVSTTWSIASNARFCVDAPGLVSGNENGIYQLDSHNMTLLAGDSVTAQKIVVGDGRTLVYRQCSRTAMKSSTYLWSWGGTSGVHFTNEIVLASPSSTLLITGAQGEPYVEKPVTGPGNISLLTTATNKNTICFRDDVNVGSILIGSNNLTNDLFVSFGGADTISLGAVSAKKDASYDCECSIIDISGVFIEMETLSGRLVISGDDTGYVTIGKILDDGELVVDGSINVTVLDAAPDAKVVLANPGSKGYRISGGTDSATVLKNVEVKNEGPLAVGGKINFGKIPSGISSLTLNNGSELYSEIPNNISVSGMGGIFIPKTWKDKVALWTDSSVSDVFRFVSQDYSHVELGGNYSYVVNSHSYPLISQWNDWRDGATHCFRQARFSKDVTNGFSRNVFPLLDTVMTLNGHPTVSMWHNGSSSSRRINITALSDIIPQSPIKTEYAIMVFGAQDGGGAAILGTKDGYFGREFGKTAEGAGNYISTNNAFTVHINGSEGCNSTEIGFSNGWQIVSMDAKGQEIFGIGALKLGTGDGGSATAVDAGFQRYAEIMLFSEAPTEAERMIAEEYLAAKWNLPCAHEGTRIPVELTLAVGSEPSEIPAISLRDYVPRSSVTVNLTFPSRPETGRYALIGGLTAASYELGTVKLASGASFDRAVLEYDAAECVLYAKVQKLGSKIIIR